VRYSLLRTTRAMCVPLEESVVLRARQPFALAIDSVGARFYARQLVRCHIRGACLVLAV